MAFRPPSAELRFELQYVGFNNIVSAVKAHQLKKGSAEFLILSLLEERARHGYEIASLIEQKSGGTLRFYVTSLYPILYRLEKEGLLEGRWVEKAGTRRRRYYRITPAGGQALNDQRAAWEEFFSALNRVAGLNLH